MASEIGTASTSSSSSCLFDIKPYPETLLSGVQNGGNPVAATSKQMPPERVATVKDKVEHTNVNRGCSSSKIDSNCSTVSEQIERNAGISTSTQLYQEVEIILIDEIEESDVEVANTEVEQPPPQRMDVTFSTSAAAKKSTPSVERSKRKRDSSNGLTSKVHDMTQGSAERPKMSRVACASTEVIANDESEDSEEVVVSDSNSMDRNSSTSPLGQQSLPSVRRSKRVSTMVSKEVEKYYEGCLVIIMDDGLPFAAGMIRKPDEDLVNHTHVGSGHDDYIYEENGVFHFYVQIFDETTTLIRVTISDLQLFDADVEPGTGFWLKWQRQTPTTIANYKNGMKIASAASKYSVEERLNKFTLRAGTSVRNLFKKIQNENSQPKTNATTPEPQTSPNESTAQGTHGNGRKCPDSVEIMKKRITEYQQKLRDECNREKDEEIKRLTADKEKLEATVKEQANMIEELQRQREKENQEKLKFREELEKMKAVFEEMFGGCGAK